MGWAITRLDSILEIQNGYAFDSKKFTPEGGMPLIRIRDLSSGSGTVINYDGDYDSKYVVKAGDFLIGMDGEFRCFEWKGPDALLNQRVCRLQDFSDGVYDKFLFYGINKYLKDIEDVTGFTTVKHISAKQIKAIEFPLPPVAEQKRIVAILDQAFADIEQARAKTEQNLKNARELFESYLQQVFSQRGEGWVELSLREASLDFGRGKSKHRPRNDESLYGGEYPFIQTGDVRNSEHLITGYSKTYNEKGLEQSKLWPMGTICITIAANIAETGIMGFEGCFPDSVIGVVVNPELTTTKYVEYLLQSFKAILQAKGQGSAQDNINLGTFEKMTFPFPDLERQKEVAESLDQLVLCVQQLEEIYTNKLASIDELKKSILQKAFTGQLSAKQAA